MCGVGLLATQKPTNRPGGQKFALFQMPETSRGREEDRKDICPKADFPHHPLLKEETDRTDSILKAGLHLGPDYGL